jgi:hypothetical protein
MAYEIPGQLITLPASTNMSTYQFRFVTANASKQAALNGDGLPSMGVLQNKPTAAGDAATIMINGVSKVAALASTLAAGDLVASSSVGLAVVPAAGDYTLGRVLEGSSGGTGRILTVLLQNIGTT